MTDAANSDRRSDRRAERVNAPVAPEKDTTNESSAAIAFEKISKRFPGVTALEEVSFEVERGTCHALLGENGAGKSTLGKILAGIYRPDEGTVRLEGRPVHFHSPRAAALAGIGIVHQELVFCPNLSVAENLCLHDLPGRRGWFDRREARRRAQAMLEAVGVDIDPQLPMAELSIAEEQMAQIAAAVGSGARVLVFDEPTSSLGQEEIVRLFALIRRLRSEGVTMLYVSHRLEEIFELCQRVTVLRDGRHVATREIATVDHDELVRLMVGRDVERPPAPVAIDQSAKPRLEVRSLSSPGKIDNISLEVRPGEIVGLAGLVGAGRTEVALAIFGLDSHATGEVEIDGQPVPRRSPASMLARRVALIPEDRKRQGLVLPMNVRQNMTLPILDRLRDWIGRPRRTEENELAGRYASQLAIRAPSLETAARSLSSGNQQKIVLAKGLATGAQVLLVDEPTRGVDVGAKQEIHQLIRQLAADGAAVLLISSELPELLALSHRVLVLREGKLVAELTHEEATAERVLRAMAGLVHV